MATKLSAPAKAAWEIDAEKHAREAYQERMGLCRPAAERLAETRKHARRAGTLHRG